jgi:hypothetical protein
MIDGTDRPQYDNETGKSEFDSLDINDSRWDELKAKLLKIISKYELNNEDVYFKKVEESNDIGWLNVYLELRTTKWTDERELKFGINSPHNDFNKDIFLNSIRIQRSEYVKNKLEIEKNKLLKSIHSVEQEKNINVIETYFNIMDIKKREYITLNLRSEKWTEK